MNEEKRGIEHGMGVGLGFILAGIYTLNLHLFLDIELFSVHKIVGGFLSLVGLAVMLNELGEKRELWYLKAISASVVLSAPVFYLFLIVEIIWVKVILVILVNLCLILVGIAIGETFLSKDGSFKVNIRKVSKVLVALLTTIGAILSFAEKLPNFINWF